MYYIFWVICLYMVGCHCWMNSTFSFLWLFSLFYFGNCKYDTATGDFVIRKVDMLVQIVENEVTLLCKMWYFIIDDRWIYVTQQLTNKLLIWFMHLYLISIVCSDWILLFKQLVSPLIRKIMRYMIQESFVSYLYLILLIY